MVAVTNGAGGVTHYRYDEAGNVTSVMDPAGRITRYEYDLLGNVLAVTDPLVCALPLPMMLPVVC